MDFMDLSGDGGVCEIKYGTEKINDYNKRLREDEYYQDSIKVVENVDNLSIFQEKPKFSLENIKPYSEFEMGIPIEREIDSEKIYNDGMSFKTREEYIKAKKEMDKQRIRNIMNFKRENDRKAKNFEEEIKKNTDFKPEIFIKGRGGDFF